MPITIAPVAAQGVERTVDAVGNLHGFDELTIKTKVSGRVARLHHEFADKVAPGELLLEIDPTDALLAVEQSKRSLNSELAKWGFTSVPEDGADLAQLPTVVSSRLKSEWSKSQLTRLMTLQSRGSVIAEELEQAKTNALVAESDYANQLQLARAGAATAQLKKAELDIAQQQLIETRVFVPQRLQTMPYPGMKYTITERMVSEGAWLAAGAELFRLVIDDPVKLRLTIPEKHAAKVEVGQRVEVKTLSSDETFVGQVTRIGPAVDPSTRTFQLEAEIPNKAGHLKTGGFATAKVVIKASDTAQTVPVSALVSYAGVHKIFLLSGDEVKEVQVELGVQTSEWVEIVQPKLPDDAQVVTSGNTHLAEGSKVRVRDVHSDAASDKSSVGKQTSAPKDAASKDAASNGAVNQSPAPAPGSATTSAEKTTQYGSATGSGDQA